MSIAAQLAAEDRIVLIAIAVAAVSAFVIWRIGCRPRPRHYAKRREADRV